MTHRFVFLLVCLACLGRGSVSGFADPRPQGTSSRVGGVVAIWLQSPSFDREAVLNMPVVKGGQVVVQWAELEPAKGKYDFSGLDAQLESYANRKLPVTLQVNGNRKPPYLFNEVPYVTERREVIAFRQIENREGTLMYWHPAHEAAYGKCLTALREHFVQSPLKSSVLGLRMNYNAFGTEYVSLIPTEKAEEYARKERWLQPPGLDGSLPYNGYSQAEAFNYVRHVIRKHLELFHGVIPLYLRCTTDSTVLREFAPELENGTLGLFETVSCYAPLGTKNEENEEWLYKYCKSGKTVGYAESFSDAWGVHSFKDEFLFSPPQAFYWRVLFDLHKGVSYIACYGRELNLALTGNLRTSARTQDGKNFQLQYSDRQSGFNYQREFNEALLFADKYAGFHALPQQAPGAWIAFRQNDAVANARTPSQKLKLPYFTGDYTFLMERLPDGSTGATKVGPDEIRYGAYARTLAAQSAMRLKLDERFAQSLTKGACRLSLIYLDDAAGPGLTLSAAGQTLKAPLRGTKAWQSASFDLVSPAFRPGADGAQVVVQNSDNLVSLHMVQIERK